MFPGDKTPLIKQFVSIPNLAIPSDQKPFEIPDNTTLEHYVPLQDKCEII